MSRSFLFGHNLEIYLGILRIAHMIWVFLGDDVNIGFSI